MNERIKQLYEQAHLVYEIPYESSVVDSTIVSTYKRRQFDAEKFAELIVRECASICELNGHSYKHSFTPAKARLAESTSNHCGLMIKKHFGVAE